MRSSAPLAGTELVSRVGSEVEGERHAEQTYRSTVIHREVDFLFFQLVARAPDCDFVGRQLDAVLVGAPENIPVKILIRAWGTETTTRAQLRRHHLHVAAQFAVGVGRPQRFASRGSRQAQ